MIRFLFVRSKQASNLLQRLGPVKRYQGRCYARSAHNNRGPNGHELLSETSSSSSDRSLMSFVIPTALLGVIGVAGYVRYNDERRSVAKGEGTRIGNVKGPTIGGPFRLIDTERKIVTEGDLLGNWVLLYFGYTSSPDVGPAEVQKMASAINILENSKHNVKLLPVFVTIDPQRDSPSQLKAYLGEFDSKIVGLTGPDNSIRQMAQEYRVFFKKVEEDGNDYLVDSSHNMYLMNPSMEMVRCFGTEYSAEDLAEAIGKELKKNVS